MKHCCKYEEVLCFPAISGQGTLKIYVEGKPWQIKSNHMNMYRFIAIKEAQIRTHKIQMTEKIFFFQASVGGGSVGNKSPIYIAGGSTFM